MFDEGDFYIELQDHGLPEQRAIRGDLVRLADEIGVKLVATNDVHYVNREDYIAQDILVRIKHRQDYQRRHGYGDGQRPILSQKL